MKLQLSRGIKIVALCPQIYLCIMISALKTIMCKICYRNSGTGVNNWKISCFKDVIQLEIFFQRMVYDQKKLSVVFADSLKIRKVISDAPANTLLIGTEHRSKGWSRAWHASNIKNNQGHIENLSMPTAEMEITFTTKGTNRHAHSDSDIEEDDLEKGNFKKKNLAIWLKLFF